MFKALCKYKCLRGNEYYLFVLCCSIGGASCLSLKGYISRNQVEIENRIDHPSNAVGDKARHSWLQVALSDQYRN